MPSPIDWQTWWDTTAPVSSARSSGSKGQSAMKRTRVIRAVTTSSLSYSVGQDRGGFHRPFRALAKLGSSGSSQPASQILSHSWRSGSSAANHGRDPFALEVAVQQIGDGLHLCYLRSAVRRHPVLDPLRHVLPGHPEQPPGALRETSASTA